MATGRPLTRPLDVTYIEDEGSWDIHCQPGGDE